MNDSYEEVVVQVYDKERLGISGICIQPEDGSVEEHAIRMCQIMACAIGREIGCVYKADEEKAVKIAARLSYEILAELSATLEKFGGENR